MPYGIFREQIRSHDENAVVIVAIEDKAVSGLPVIRMVH